MKKLLLGLALFIGTFASAQTTRFVATAANGGNDANACTSGSPCLTFNRAFTVAASGDIVSVGNGSYAAQTISGTGKTSAVTFQSSAGAACGISCPVTLAGFTFNSSWATIVNMTVTGDCGALPANLANSPTTVTHNSFIGGSCRTWFIVGQDILVRDSNVGPYNSCTGGGPEDGVDIWQNNPGVASTRVTFDHDVIHDISDNGNECGSGKHVDGMQILAGHFITVTRTTFYNNATSDIIARPFNDTLDNIDIENNYMQEVVTPGAALNLGNSTDTISGTNKVWYNRIESVSVIFSSGTVSMKGNIFATGSCQTGGVYDHNVFDPSFSAVCGTNGVKGTPQFVGPTPSPSFGNGIVPNYAIKSTDTLAKDHGDPANFPATDIVGTTRPQGGTPDIGAFEVTSTSSAAAPTFSPIAGTYVGTQSVSLSTTSGGAIICYTTTGTTPATNGTTGCTTGTLYAGAISVATTQTVKAIAGGTGFTDSTVASAAYTINAVATPTAPSISIFSTVLFFGRVLLH